MPLFGKNITVGLEVAGQVLRAVQIEHRQDRPRLLALETQDLPTSSPGVLTAEGPVWKVVKFGRRGGHVVVNVPGSGAFIRKIRVEASEMSCLRDWVMWEAKQYLPTPLEEYFIDFQKLRPGEESGLWEILLVAARRDAVSKRARLFQTVNLKPAIMDVDPLALQNAFEANYPGAVDFPVALVNLERDLVTIVATWGGVPEGVSNMAAAPEPEKLCEQIHNCVDDLLQRIGRDGGKWERFDKILLSGGGPHLKDVANFLSSDGKQKVELADPFRELTILPALRDKLDQSYLASEFMLATGLALRKT
jgi:Tfp pilus assembly PilM family ATPase